MWEPAVRFLHFFQGLAVGKKRTFVAVIAAYYCIDYFSFFFFFYSQISRAGIWTRRRWKMRLQYWTIQLFNIYSGLLIMWYDSLLWTLLHNYYSVILRDLTSFFRRSIVRSYSGDCDLWKISPGSQCPRCPSPRAWCTFLIVFFYTQTQS